MKRRLFLQAQHQSKKGETIFRGEEYDSVTARFLRRLESNDWAFSVRDPAPEGFVRKDHGMSRHVYVGKNFVVKKPYTCGEMPKAAIPTTMFKKGWRVQPVCIPFFELTYYMKRKFIDKKMVKMDKIFQNYYLKIRGAGGDAHHYNFGLFNNELVQFDW